MEKHGKTKENIGKANLAIKWCRRSFRKVPTSLPKGVAHRTRRQALKRIAHAATRIAHAASAVRRITMFSCVFQCVFL